MTIIDFPKPELQPGESRKLSDGQRSTDYTNNSLQAFRAVLEAIRNGVLVTARDIPKAQRKEIARELGFMHWGLQEARKARDLPDLPGTLHLQRDDAA